MADYVTVADVDALLGAGWQGTGDADRAVLEANTYLSGYSFKSWDAQPVEITRAGAELARIAAQGELYADSEPVVVRSRVRADTVEVDETYAEGSRATTGAMAFIGALIAPWLINRGSVRILKKL